MVGAPGAEVRAAGVPDGGFEVFGDGVVWDGVGIRNRNFAILCFVSLCTFPEFIFHMHFSA